MFAKILHPQNFFPTQSCMYAGIFVHKIQLKAYLIAVFVQPSIMTETEQSKIHRYKASLVGLWNMLHGTSYTLEHEFTTTNCSPSRRNK